MEHAWEIIDGGAIWPITIEIARLIGFACMHWFSTPPLPREEEGLFVCPKRFSSVVVAVCCCATTDTIASLLYV